MTASENRSTWHSAAFFLTVCALLMYSCIHVHAFPSPVISTRSKNAKKTAAKPVFTKSVIFSSTAGTTSSEGVNGNPAISSRPSKFLTFAKLRQVSNFASLLCVLDCTLLPIITVALPLVGIINLGAAQMEWLHHLGHSLALFFVLPVGGLTTIVNFLSHRKAWISSLASLGLFMVGMANSHIHDLPLLGHVEWLHTIQHGPMHRVVNIVGCAFLLGSNYLSQKQGCAHDHGPSSSHSHDHSHSHSHKHE